VTTTGTPIDAITVAVYRFPTDRPEADGTLSWDATTAVTAIVHAGNRQTGTVEVGVGHVHVGANHHAARDGVAHVEVGVRHHRAGGAHRRRSAGEIQAREAEKQFVVHRFAGRIGHVLAHRS
jgi:carbohydrate-selective porin OprB